MTVLMAAEAWGTPPWEFAGGNPLTWMFRWQSWKEQEYLKFKQRLEPDVLNGTR